MPRVHIMDTILRDAHQCLIATRLQTADMLPICPQLDAIGYWSLEVWGGATFDSCIRFLREDPWERLRLLRKALPNTRLQMLLRGQNLLGYRHYPDDVVRLFVKKAANNGIDVFRIFDALNDIRNLQTAITAVKKEGKHAQGAVAYTISPVHDIDAFVKTALELEELGCDSIAIKDMAGLLTPNVAAQLTQALTKKLHVPLHIHSHATTGVSSICLWEAVKNGCLHIDTAISAFSEGSSHPCTESMVLALKNTPYDTGLNLAALQDIGEYFFKLRKKYQRFFSEGPAIDTRMQLTQIPGGMISNLYNQMRQQQVLDKMPEVQKEIPRVRADLGYPPLVTPTSQIVGTQALLNVVSGERYKVITNEVKLYLQGKYGKPPGEINHEVQCKAIGQETSIIDQRPADLLSDEVDSLRKEIGDLAKSDEDVLIYAMFPDLGKEFLQQRADGTLKPEPITPDPQAIGTPKDLPPHDFKVRFHGEEYNIAVTGCGDKHEKMRPFYVVVDGVPEEVMIESEEWGVEQTTVHPVKESPKSSRPIATLPGHVSCAMPAVVVQVLVEKGQTVRVGDPVLVVEAMKMETEIQSSVAGVIESIHTQKGDKVNPGELLIEIKE